MAAAREQARERRLEWVGRQVERRDVALEVVDRDERQVARPRDRLGGRDADEQRADEARALRDADAVDVVEPSPASSSASRDHRRDQLEVAPRRDLGHHAAVPRVKVRLRGHHRREQLALLA